MCLVQSEYGETYRSGQCVVCCAPGLPDACLCCALIVQVPPPADERSSSPTTPPPVEEQQSSLSTPPPMEEEQPSLSTPPPQYSYEFLLDSDEWEYFW